MRPRCTQGGAGAVRLGPRTHRHPAVAGRGDISTCPARPTNRRSRASTPRSRTRKSAASPTPTSRSAGWSSRSSPTRTATCASSASTPACSRPNSRAVYNPGKDKRKSSPNSGTSRPTAASEADGRRPATSSASSACGTRSPATRCATRSIRSCSRRSSFPIR